MPLVRTSHLQGQEEDVMLLRQLRDVTKQRVQALRASKSSFGLSRHVVAPCLPPETACFTRRMASIGSYSIENRTLNASCSGPTASWRLVLRQRAMDGPFQHLGTASNEPLRRPAQSRL